MRCQNTKYMQCLLSIYNLIKPVLDFIFFGVENLYTYFFNPTVGDNILPAS